MRRGRILLQGAFACFAYLVALILTMPVRYSVASVLGSQAFVQMQDLTGTILTGRAAQLHVGNFDLGPVQWTLEVLPLLAGCLSYSVDFQGPPATGRGTIAGCVRDRTTLREVRLRTPAQSLAPWFGATTLKLGGDMVLELPLVDVSARTVENGRGTLEWKGAAITAGALRAAMPDHWTMKIDAQQGVVTGDFADAGPRPWVSGAVTLGAGGTVRVVCTVDAANADNAGWTPLLTTLSARRDGTYYRVDWSGKLWTTAAGSRAAAYD